GDKWSSVQIRLPRPNQPRPLSRQQRPGPDGSGLLRCAGRGGIVRSPDPSREWPARCVCLTGGGDFVPARRSRGVGGGAPSSSTTMAPCQSVAGNPVIGRVVNMLQAIDVSCRTAVRLAPKGQAGEC